MNYSAGPWESAMAEVCGKRAMCVEDHIDRHSHDDRRLEVIQAFRDGTGQFIVPNVTV